eukprot:366260-Chlamydomonas_euryale.AAC.14
MHGILIQFSWLQHRCRSRHCMVTAAHQRAQFFNPPVQENLEVDAVERSSKVQVRRLLAVSFLNFATQIRTRTCIECMHQYRSKCSRRSGIARDPARTLVLCPVIQPSVLARLGYQRQRLSHAQIATAPDRARCAAMALQSGLANLPSAGLLPGDASAISWVRHSGRSLIGESGPPADGEQQVLENDNATESLVRILKRQQQAEANAARVQRSGADPGGARGAALKRPAEGDAGGRAGAGGGAKRLLIAPALASSGAGTSAPRVAGAPAVTTGPGASCSGAGPSRVHGGVDAKRMYSQDELRAKTLKDLGDLLKQRGLPVSGKKEQLMQRLIDFQRRQKMATLAHGAGL